MDDDFSFVSASRGRPDSTNSAAAPPGPVGGRGGGAAMGASGSGGRGTAAAGTAGASPSRPRIAIPTASEVAAREQQRGATVVNLFRPSSVAGSGQQPPGAAFPPAAAAAVAPPPPAAQFGQQPYAAAPSRPAPALGLPISLPRHAEGPGGMPAPPPHQQHQQQQGLPPLQQQQVAAVAAAAAAGVSANTLLVSPRQQGNPILKHIKMVRWQFRDITADYQMGPDAAAVFLSIRYHLLHPNYVLPRLKALSRGFRLLVLLVHVDSEEAVKPLRELTRIAVGLDATLVCGFSTEECARYLELFKSYEQKPAAAIQSRTDTDYVGRLTSALTSVRGVNRNDAYTIGATFGTLADAFRAGPGKFAACPGLGPVKARRLHDAFSQPFRRALAGRGEQGQGRGGAAAAAAAVDGAGGPAAAGGDAQVSGSSQGGSEAGAAAAAAQEGSLEQQLTQQVLELPISDDDDGDMQLDEDELG